MFALTWMIVLRMTGALPRSTVYVVPWYLVLVLDTSPPPVTPSIPFLGDQVRMNGCRLRPPQLSLPESYSLVTAGLMPFPPLSPPRLHDFQPDLTKSLLEQIREAHQDYLKGVDGTPREEKGKGKGNNKGKGKGAATGSGSGGGGGEAAAAAAGPWGTAAAGGGGGGGTPSSAAWYEADALALVPLFSEHASSTGEMNFLNKTTGAMSLAADVAGIASSIGQGGSLAGFLRDLGHTCCSTTSSLRQAIRVRKRERETKSFF